MATNSGLIVNTCLQDNPLVLLKDLRRLETLNHDSITDLKFSHIRPLDYFVCEIKHHNLVL